ncbi:MAG: 3-dehydroquinate synthase [Oscillospiraceae bacterium]|nr:3-dehydroquinate synthase [Oscillospiraceae bacterium]
MSVVNVTASRSYDVTVSDGILDKCGEFCKPLVKGKTAVIVSDDNVFPLYGKRVTKSLENEGFVVKEFVVPHGERSKSLSSYINLLEFLFESDVTRSDLLVALGGGVVGDLCGFAAATYQRGVQFVQIPTTLLAMVDSSVGGKTAVNLENGKNQVGSFYQPSAVICDPKTLSTLPEEEYLCGCAEVIKYAVLFSEEFFSELEETPAKDQLENVITTCVTMKRDIVKADEFDTGERMLLNLGHTVGHAVEGLSGFQTLHGQAVAIGLATISRSAAKYGYLSEADCNRIISLLDKYGLPTETEYTIDDMYTLAVSDKKSSGDAITIIVPRKIGHCERMKFPKSQLKDWL